MDELGDTVPREVVGWSGSEKRGPLGEGEGGAGI